MKAAELSKYLPYVDTEKEFILIPFEEYHRLKRSERFLKNLLQKIKKFQISIDKPY